MCLLLYVDILGDKGCLNFVNARKLLIPSSAAKLLMPMTFAARTFARRGAFCRSTTRIIGCASVWIPVSVGPSLLPHACHCQFVCVNIVMSVLNGFEAAGKIRQASPRSRVVILRSYADEQLLREPKNVGGIGYMPKSDAEQELIEVVKAVPEARPSAHCCES